MAVCPMIRRDSLGIAATWGIKWRRLQFGYWSQQQRKVRKPAILHTFTRWRFQQTYYFTHFEWISCFLCSSVESRSLPNFASVSMSFHWIADTAILTVLRRSADQGTTATVVCKPGHSDQNMIILMKTNFLEMKSDNELLQLAALQLELKMMKSGPGK